jgi:hypothetical protein
VPPIGSPDWCDRVKRSALLREINFGIALRGFQTNVAEPVTNQIELDASLEEVYCAGVSKRVGMHAFASE